MRKNKWALTSLIAVILLSTVVASPGVLASSLSELQKEKKVVDQKKSELSTSIKKKEKELKTNQSSIESITQQIKTLDNKVKETHGNITRVEAEIAETTGEIEALHSSIADLEEKIAERDVVLRERVRAMQVTGDSVNYLDVLLRANSFSDFIDRFSAVTTLLDADRSIMKQQAEDIEQLEKEKALVEKKLAEQEGKRTELEGLKASLESQKKQKDNLVKELEIEQQKLNAEKTTLEETYEEAHEISKELENEIVSEQKRIAEIARKAAEERRKQAGSSNSSSSAPPPSVSSGSWTKPANGRSTSGFGWRVHPITGVSTQHRGADIANSIGTPVVAAGDGVVSRAQSHSSYGNHIMITHVINGQTYTTVYAHLSSMNVSAGQHVSKGELIGKMGNTGRSTGPHLHFEFHIGYYSGYGPSAVNPWNYVPR